MNKVLAIVVSAILTIIQVTVFPMLKIGWINYNFALVTIVVLCCLCGGKTAIINAAIVSFIYDIFASDVLGTYILIYMLIAIIIQLLSKHMFSRNIKASVVFTLAATLISELVVYWICYAFNGMAYNAFVLSKIILPQCIVNLVVCLVVFWLFKSVLKVKRD